MFRLTYALLIGLSLLLGGCAFGEPYLEGKFGEEYNQSYENTDLIEYHKSPHPVVSLGYGKTFDTQWPRLAWNVGGEVQAGHQILHGLNDHNAVVNKSASDDTIGAEGDVWAFKLALLTGPIFKVAPGWELYTNIGPAVVPLWYSNIDSKQLGVSGASGSSVALAVTGNVGIRREVSERLSLGADVGALQTLTPHTIAGVEDTTQAFQFLLTARWKLNEPTRRKPVREEPKPVREATEPEE